MSIELNQNGDIITLLCNDKGELGMMSKDELEEFIYNNVGIAVNISDDMLSEFRKNGRLDITTTVEEKVTVEQQSTPNKNPFEKGEGNKEEYTGNKIQRNEFSVFGNNTNLKGYELIAPYMEKEYMIVEGIIRRGQAAVHFKHNWISPTKMDGKIRNIGSIRINLLEKIACDVWSNCTGMDNRNVISHIVQKKNNEIWIMADFDLEDNEGPVTAKYRLVTMDYLIEQMNIF